VRPAVTLDLPCCFEVVSHTADLLVLGEAGLARYILIANPAEVIDPGTGEPAALPDDLAAWLADHPMLDVTGPVQRTMGGAPFREVEGVPRPDAEYNVNGELLLARGRAASGAPIFVAADHRFRLAAGDGPDGPLLVGIVARSDRFEEFLPTAESIVASLEFTR
jgi:hypothetical protein